MHALNDVYQTIFRTIFISTLTITLLFIFNPTKEPIQTRRISIKKENISINYTKVFPFIPGLNQHVFHRDSCRIEVFGGFEGIERAYISGVLFRDIPQTCSCYLHYQPIEQFSKTEHEPMESISNDSLNLARIVWCVLGCPKDVTQWCKNQAHRMYCQKYVILFDLFDENLDFQIDHYSYFAAVYRNYLRHDTGNYLTYLTNDLRKLLEVNNLKYIHRILNWTLAINIMKEEWRNVGFDASNLSHTPTSDLLNQINNRIISRILIHNESISYHTWPHLDVDIRKNAKRKLAVFWFPLGFTMTYLYNTVQSSVGPLSQRKKLWTWFGSMKLNERIDMVQRFELNDTLAHYIRERGRLLISDSSNIFLIHMDYIAEVLDTQFVPLPRGYSPEQYRSYETVEGGAILIVNEDWLKIRKYFKLEPLAYLDILGYDPVTLTKFSNLPEKLLELSRLPLDLLDHWQSIMLLRHRILMHTLTKHIATVVCATTRTPNGYVHQEDQD